MNDSPGRLLRTGTERFGLNPLNPPWIWTEICPHAAVVVGLVRVG